MATWRELIAETMEDSGESWADVVACTMTDAELDIVFDDIWGDDGRFHFTFWTTKRVYFPTGRDGQRWCGSVPRHPCDEKT